MKIINSCMRGVSKVEIVMRLSDKHWEEIGYTK